MMRIDSQNALQNDRLSKQVSGNKTNEIFSNAMKKSQSKLQNDSFNQLMSRVDIQGQKLTNQRTLENVINYKQAIKQFVSETVRYGLHLSDEQSQVSGGGMKSQQIIKVIDKKLIEIQDQVLNNEEEGIGTLGLVGEIRGLLINLYM
ncbi:YaaR [Planococcus halocryophilus Or1]|nr:YaaR family protein [Planococcus halocryophilus]EMF45214.1 YaaR [Planococcus halocryophilus Or1]